MTSSSIRLGVIGAGSAFEKLRWPVLKRLPRAFRVRAVASRSRERVEAAAAPAALILNELTSDRVVAVAENFRYRPDLTAARGALDRGTVWEPFAFQLKVLPAYPGGFLLDAGIHAVAFLQHLLGDVCEVSATTLDRHPSIGGPDSLIMQVMLRNGIRGQFFACYTAKAKRESPLRVAVYGSQGTLEVRPGCAVRAAALRAWSDARPRIAVTRGSGATSATRSSAGVARSPHPSARTATCASLRPPCSPHLIAPFVVSHTVCDTINRIF